MKKVYKFFKDFIYWIVGGIILGVVGNYVYDKIKGVNLLQICLDWCWNSICLWFINQLNTLTVILIFVIIIGFVIYQLRKSNPKIEMLKDKICDSGNDITMLTSNQKKFYKIAKEIKDKNLISVFETVIGKVQDRDSDWDDIRQEDLIFFLKKRLIERGMSGAIDSYKWKTYKLTELGHNVSDEL